jgi:hypothetical protein
MTAINSIFPDRLLRARAALPCDGLLLRLAIFAAVGFRRMCAADVGKSKTEAGAATHVVGTSPSPRTPSFASGVDL